MRRAGNIVGLLLLKKGWQGGYRLGRKAIALLVLDANNCIHLPAFQHLYCNLRDNAGPLSPLNRWCVGGIPAQYTRG